MANPSIYAVFERMWQHVLVKFNNYVSIEVFNDHASNKADLEHTHNTDHITSGILNVDRGGTGYDSIVDTTYTTARYRASALRSTETTPTDNGVINWVYE